MALGKRTPRKTPLGVFVMAMLLVASAFLGAAAGLVWQGADWFDEEPEEEVLTRDRSPA